MTLLRMIGPPLLALLTVVGIHRMTAGRGLEPPGFRLGPGTVNPAGNLVRLSLAMGLLWIVLWIGVFWPLGLIGEAQQPIDTDLLSPTQLFLLHGLLVVCLVVWYGLGFLGSDRAWSREGGSWRAQLGFRADDPLREIGIGLVAGLGAWMAVLGVLLTLGLALWALGGEDALPQEPPTVIPWIAGLSIWLRLAVSLSAGVVEETFFRGFLQPRVGIALSSLLFVLAHASYEQPLMLVGVGLLSLAYGFLVRWRQSIWAAIAAHALFDSIQLLVVIPAALGVLPEGGAGTLATALTTALTGLLG